jgi:hypothetical protein
MAKRVNKRTYGPAVMNQWWGRALVALVFIVLAYGFASLAINSGNLLEYLITLVLLWWAVKHAVRAIRFVFAR